MPTAKFNPKFYSIGYRLYNRRIIERPSKWKAKRKFRRFRVPQVSLKQYLTFSWVRQLHFFHRSTNLLRNSTIINDLLLLPSYRWCCYWCPYSLLLDLQKARSGILACLGEARLAAICFPKVARDQSHLACVLLRRAF